MLGTQGSKTALQFTPHGAFADVAWSPPRLPTKSLEGLICEVCLRASTHLKDQLIMILEVLVLSRAISNGMRGARLSVTLSITANKPQDINHTEVLTLSSTHYMPLLRLGSRV